MVEEICEDCPNHPKNIAKREEEMAKTQATENQWIEANMPAAQPDNGNQNYFPDF